MSKEKTQGWDIIITSKRKNYLSLKDFKDIIDHRDLIFNFVNRDFVTQYKQTILGPLWYLIQPILTTIVFTIIFGNIARIPTDGLPGPLFYLGGITLWNFFSSTLTSTSNIFTSNAGIFGKVYFPRIVVPISIMISNYIRLLIQFLLFLSIYIFFIFNLKTIRPNIYLLFLPLILIQLSLLSLACGMFISSITTKYRDLQYLVGFGVQLWMYASPVVYPISQIAEKWQWVFIVNPVSYSLELFKYAFTGYGTLNLKYFFISCFVTIILLLLSFRSFKKAEETFIDRV
ncbi:MAG TPA: ABC transporter permease [Spirochaetota bacterium]|nr:ABC transporter permease [Spirochaetota bacterium]HOL56993.1 ABC transporter permease [Spirochaetota bacterium]HPP05523.1 ABC transporter permease [Spirochaetota bacterium]